MTDKPHRMFQASGVVCFPGSSRSDSGKSGFAHHEAFYSVPLVDRLEFIDQPVSEVLP